MNLKTISTACSILFLILVSCNGKDDLWEQSRINLQKRRNAPPADRYDFTSSCNNTVYLSRLAENKSLDSNAFILSIESLDGKLVRKDTMDLPLGLAAIRTCTDDYTLISFACGGPCYTEVFVFIKQDRPNEYFSYSQRVEGNSNLIAHIRNEEFETLIVRNFDTKKELKVDISDAAELTYGVMESLHVEKNNLVVYYYSNTNKLTKKTVKLNAIL